MVFEFSAMNPMGKNGLTRCSWIQNHDGTNIKWVVRDVDLPLGVSDFQGKLSVLVKLDEDKHKDMIGKLADLTSAAIEHWSHLHIPNPCEDKGYGLQVRVKLTGDTKFFDKDKKKGDVGLVKYHCNVDIMFQPQMVWVSGEKAGISFKAVQIKKNEVASDRVATENEICEM